MRKGQFECCFFRKFTIVVKEQGEDYHKIQDIYLENIEGKIFYDEMNRVADYICGTFADFNYIDEYYANMAANCRRGHWYCANLTTVKKAMTKERLINSGFYDLATAYQSVHVNY